MSKLGTNKEAVVKAVRLLEVLNKHSIHLFVNSDKLQITERWIKEAREGLKEVGLACGECGAITPKEGETVCIRSGDKDDCHGCALWEDE